MSYLNNPKIVDLRNLVKQKYGVAAFIGAGCSSVLRIPLWTELLIELNKEFKYYSTEQALIKDIDMIGHAAVASNIKSKATDDPYKELIKKFTKPVACHFTSLHVELIRLTKTILTTNYDESFEETLNALKRFHQSEDCEYTQSSLGDFNYNGLGIERNIYHVHGVSSTGDVVLTTESYFNQYEDPNSSVRTLINAIFSSYSTVFVGFSFEDQSFMKFLENSSESIKIEKSRTGKILPKHYCIMSNNLEKKHFSAQELEGHKVDIGELLSKSILTRDDTTFPGKTVFRFDPDALDIIKTASLPDEIREYLLKSLKLISDNNAKIDMLAKLQIEIIYFEENNYLQIEMILRALNEAVPSSASSYTPN